VYAWLCNFCQYPEIDPASFHEIQVCHAIETVHEGWYLRGNTDVLEHCFAHIRQHERNFNIQDGQRGVAGGAARRLNSYGGNNKAKCTSQGPRL
jgi:hypothetical protein